MKYVYFVVFDGADGIANIALTLPYPITAMEHIRDIERAYKNKYGEHCVVTWYQLLRVETQPEAQG